MAETPSPARPAYPTVIRPGDARQVIVASTVEEPPTALFVEEDPGRLGAGRLGIGGLMSGPQDGLPVERGQQDVDGDVAAAGSGRPGQGAAGQVAAPAEATEEGPLGLDRPPGGGLVDRLQATRSLVV